MSSYISREGHIVCFSWRYTARFINQIASSGYVPLCKSLPFTCTGGMILWLLHSSDCA